MLSAGFQIGKLEPWNTGWGIWVDILKKVGSLVCLESSEVEKRIHSLPENLIHVSYLSQELFLGSFQDI